MASILKVDKLDPQSAAALEIGTSGDTINVPSGVTLDINSGATLDATGATITGAIGKILQVQFAQFESNTEVTSIASQTATFLTDQITPSATTSKIMVTMNFSSKWASTDPDGRWQGAYRIFRSINGGTYAGVYPEGDVTDANLVIGVFDSDDLFQEQNVNICFVDEPSTTSTVDYKLYIRIDEGNNWQVGRDIYSQVILQEIGV